MNKNFMYLVRLALPNIREYLQLNSVVEELLVEAFKDVGDVKSQIIILAFVG
jgi:hypothetical protein